MRGKVNYQIWNWLSVSNNTSFVSTTRKKPSYYNLSDFYDAEPHDMDVNPDGTWANSELGIALAQLVDWRRGENRLRPFAKYFLGRNEVFGKECWC